MSKRKPADEAETEIAPPTLGGSYIVENGELKRQAHTKPAEEDTEAAAEPATAPEPDATAE